MAFVSTLLVVLIASYNLYVGDGHTTLNIIDFNAQADDITDDSQVFKQAWKALCEANNTEEPTTLVIPKNKTFTVQAVQFSGPCTSSDLRIQIDGKIEGPESPKKWSDNQQKCLLCFSNVTGLSIHGSGLIDAHGETWWESIAHDKRPRTVKFDGCNNIVYEGLTLMNSPKNHISIHNCTNTTLFNLHLIAPEDSPNTDGIDISLSNSIHILNSSIETGDDCIAINGGSYNIDVTLVACGPGHGISIGSLGRDGQNDTVRNVNVRNCSFNGTQNGARIKTWEGGVGFAKNILFENITVIDSYNPIIIDQHYCNGHNDCAHKETAIDVSNVIYIYFTGTSADEIAIKLDCDEKIGCRKIVMEHINLTSSSPEKHLRAYCNSAELLPLDVSVDLQNCLSDQLGPFPPPYYFEP